MKIALLSDAHGNPIALRACLDAIADLGAERLYFLGDAVGYLDDVAEVLDLLRDAGAICQKGNHEAMLLGELPLDPVRDRIYRIAPARARLGSADRAWVASWPEYRPLVLGGVRVLLAHASPAPSLTQYVNGDEPIALPADFEFQATFMGHTHVPFVRDVDGVCVANVGSCGLPRDQGNLAAFAIFDTSTRSATVFRVEFDRDLVVAALGQTCAPEVRDVLFRTRPAFGERIAPT